MVWLKVLFVSVGMTCFGGSALYAGLFRQIEGDDGLSLAMGAICFVPGLTMLAFVLRFIRIQLRSFTQATQRHGEILSRLRPAWAKVVSVTIGAPFFRDPNGDPPTVLAGTHVRLELLVQAAHGESAGYREGEAETHMFSEQLVEPQVAPLLGPGAWLEIAFDPHTLTVVGQTLVTREGAKCELREVDI